MSGVRADKFGTDYVFTQLHPDIDLLSSAGMTSQITVHRLLTAALATAACYSLLRLMAALSACCGELQAVGMSLVSATAARVAMPYACQLSLTV